MRWLAAFALILLAATATPVLADEPVEGPDFSQIEQEELERAEWLEGPEAAQQREESRTAYTNLSTGESQDLFLKAFPVQLKALNADPARVLSELEIEEPLGTYGALIASEEGGSEEGPAEENEGEESEAEVVESEEGGGEIVESSVPVESELGGEGKEPVDLAIQPEGSDFAPENPLTEVTLPGSAEDSIELHDGLEVEIPASDDHEAEPLGSMNLFYPETETTTDTLLSPVAGGVEIFEQLRSPESPEQYRFGLNLPSGTTLQMREDGGAEIVSSEKEMIAEVPPPAAVDAQGVPVSVTMSVEGEDLMLEVPHRSSEPAYPLLVDPVVLDHLDDSAPGDSTDWHTTASDKDYAFAKGNSAGGIPYVSVWAKKGESFGANTDGKWIYTAPGQTAFIEEANFGAMHFEGCKSQPHGYLALHNPSAGWYAGTLSFSVSAGKGNTGSVDKTSYSTGRVGGYGYREAVIGVGTANESIGKTECITEMKVHGATLRENDPEYPSLSVSGIPTSGWINPANVGNASIAAADAGFGILEIAISDGEGGATPSNFQNCNGLSGHRCPSEVKWQVPPPLNEGENTLKVTAKDPLQKVTTWQVPTRVDNKAPLIGFKGQLAVATEEEGLEGAENEASKNKLSLPTYNLHIESTDGNPNGKASEFQSGVKNIEILLDGKSQEVPWGPQGCTETVEDGHHHLHTVASANCNMVEDYTLDLPGLTAGEHELTVVASDQVGHVEKRPIEFEYIPATGMSDEYVMQHFPLPDGNEGEEENEAGRPELAVNVMNGNVVYHQRDVEVSGPNVDLNIDRYYNSQLPKEESSEWGEGWTLAQTPKLEVEAAPKEKAQDDRAAIRQSGGLIERAVPLPDHSGDRHFDPRLQAALTKTVSDHYTLTDESGSTDDTFAFNGAGKTTELQTPGYAKVEYGYESGDLAEVAVHDPTIFSGTPSEGPQQPDEFESPAYIDSFGGLESGPGRLSSPAAVAVGPEGDLWVADSGHRRIQRFDENGAFVDEFGISGSYGGEFLEPRAIAVDAKGNVWVADKSQNKVQKLDAEGKYLSSFGSYGTSNGKFTALQGIAVDPEGHIWTVEGGKSKSRVQEFSSSGTYIAQFGTAGTADGQLKEPQGIAIDAKGNIWIADTANNRVQEFSSSGTFIRKLGTSGSGQLSGPTALSIDPEGNVWVTDTGNNRIVQFSSEGAYLSQVGTAGADKGQFSAPRGIVVDTKGRLWVADTTNNRIQEFGASGFLRSFGGQGSEGGNLSAPAATATDKEGNVWVADTAHNRVQEFSSKGEFIRQFGAKGSSAGLFSEPHGIAVDSAGHVWVADTGNYRVQELSSKGEFIRQLGNGIKGCANGNFNEVRGVAVDPAGHVWTTDAASTCSRVQEFSSTGTYIRKFGTYGTSYNQFENPKGIAADSKGNVWVADTGNSRLAEYTGEGKFVRLVEKMQLNRPAGIAVDSEGNLWIADTYNDRIQQFSSEGSYLGQFGTRGNEDGQLNRPEGIATDAKGNLWIADTLNDRVQEVAASQFVRKFGGQGSGIGQLSGPQDVAMDSEGNVWVADTTHNRIQEFGPTGAPLREVSTFGNEMYSMPLGIATDADDDVWVAEEAGLVIELDSKGKFIRQFDGLGDTGEADYSSLGGVAVDPEGHVWTIQTGGDLVEFTPEGQLLNQFSGEGTEEGRLHDATDIAFDPEGHLWVTDAGDNRVKEFTPQGKFLQAFGGWGVTAGYLDGPSGLSVDARGNVWVADTDNNRVQTFNSEGTYLGQFGTPGNNYGELNEPQGIATDTYGRVWVADTANNRIQKWLVPQLAFAHDSVYDSAAGAKGTGAGKLKHPAGVAIDDQGDIWVADSENSRVVQFDKQGEFVKMFGWGVNQTKEAAETNEAEWNLCTAASGDKCQAGWSGSEPGQLRRPADVAIDGKGDVWVADMGYGGRVVQFNQAGEYLSEFETGYSSEPEGIAIAPDGNIWVSRIGASRGWVEEFTPTGKWITTADPFGVASEPAGIDVGPGGNLWIADWEGNQIVEFNSEGRYIRKFGSYGTANGQFHHPDNVFVDDRGQVWVADEGNNRIETFTEQGEYITQLGSKGPGEGQFELEYPAGLATDSKGSLWVADSRHGRLQRFGIYNAVPADETGISEDAPEVQVEESAEGLVESVQGEEAGETTYTHEGDLLTAVEGPDSEADYEYVVVNGMELLKKVTLPNGTWAEVKYDAIGRATSVSVSIRGDKAKTTKFKYVDVPRETIVSAEGEPPVTYEIGADGSIFKWHDAANPPVINEPEGTLWDQRLGKSTELTRYDQNLNASARSNFGIASIQIVANGNQLIAEAKCDQNLEAEEECPEEAETFYVTEAEDLPPGIMQFEVIATDTLGQSSSLRFEDNVPYFPPPDPELPEPPRFNEVLHFREEFGLDLDLKGNQRAINERIFKLISDWHDPSTPEGEVAVASWERWGVPLRAVDVAELEYRERYIAQAAISIPEWAESHAPNTYAGYYVDQRQGGIIHVGFAAGNQAQIVAQLIGELADLAPGRIDSFESTPTYTLSALVDGTGEFLGGLPEGSEVSEALNGMEFDIQANRVTLETSNVAATNAYVAGLPSSSRYVVSYAPSVSTESEELPGSRTAIFKGPNRYRQAERRLLSADAIFGFHSVPESGLCSMGFGAREPTGKSKPNGQAIEANFALTAGHCFEKGSEVWRWAKLNGANVEFSIGTVGRRAHSLNTGEKRETDAEAIRLYGNYEAPDAIWLEGKSHARTGSATVPYSGETACLAATQTKPDCGTIIGMKLVQFEEGRFPTWVWRVKGIHTLPGNSGGPVRDPHGNHALGIWTGGGRFFTPILESLAYRQGKNVGRNVGVLKAPQMGDMTIVSK